jgi:peptidoglycan/xylan/chitin deacetylase (PgdA/CDA1 family)
MKLNDNTNNNIIAIITIIITIIMIFILIWWYLMDLAKWYFNKKKYDIIWTFKNIEFLELDKSIYLTIDDVINNNSFEEILDVLDEFNVKATFFVISSLINKQNEKLLSRAIRSGHHLANHGKTNCKHFLCSYARLYEEIIDCEKLIARIYNDNNVVRSKIKYFRPGNAYVTEKILKICESNNYKIVLGSIYPQDTLLPFPNLIYYYIITKIKPNDIIILHDSKYTPSILKKTLNYLKKKNYEIKSLI